MSPWDLTSARSTNDGDGSPMTSPPLRSEIDDCSASWLTSAAHGSKLPRGLALPRREWGPVAESLSAPDTDSLRAVKLMNLGTPLRCEQEELSRDKPRHMVRGWWTAQGMGVSVYAGLCTPLQRTSLQSTTLSLP